MDRSRAQIKQTTKQLLRRTIGEPYVGKRLKMRRLEHKLPGMQLDPRAILDAGAEDATFVYWLADRFPKAIVTATDIDEAAIAACVATRPVGYEDRVTFKVGRFADLEPVTFDLITAFDVLEHIEDDLEAAESLARALRPGGTLLVHVPRDRWITRDGTVHAVPDEEAWRINPGHVRAGYSPESLTKLLSSAGFVVEEVEPWLGRWGTLAHTVYSRLERPAPLRLLSIPVTDVCAAVDRRQGTPEGNTVYARATKPATEPRHDGQATRP